MRPAGCEDTASFTDRVAMEHQMKQYQQEYDRWRHNLLQQTKVCNNGKAINIWAYAEKWDPFCHCVQTCVGNLEMGIKMGIIEIVLSLYVSGKSW